MNFFFKNKILIFIVFFAFSLIAKGEEDLDELFDETATPCQKIPKTFETYNNDIQLERLAVKFTLSGIKSSLVNMSDSSRVLRGDLLKMITELEEVDTLITDNELSLLLRSDKIEYSLAECLNKRKL